MLALEWLGGKDADAPGLVDAKQDAACFPLPAPGIAACLDFPADLIEHRGGALHQERTLRNLPGFEVGARLGPPPFFGNFIHVGKEHIGSQLSL
jgi:hypothetical protein